MFAEVKKKVNVGEGELRLITGTKDLNDHMDKMIADVGISHGSCICIVMKLKGGSDPRLQLLHNCDNKDVIGVSTPSVRACPHCGALVQHTQDCKHMDCQACGKSFCFICLKVPNPGWQCGRYNAKCTPAKRQMKIPG